ncbi:MAG: hypothetical protein ACF8R7_16410 [Phycisphaerales bacterium JB039]
MSDTSSHSPEKPAGAPDDLTQRVESLLEQIDRATARIEQAVGEGAGALPPGVERPTIAPPQTQIPPPPPDAPPGAPGAEAASEPNRTPGPAATPEPPRQSHPREPVESAQTLEMLDADLEEDLDRLLAAERTEPAPAAAPARAAPPPLELPAESPAEPDLEQAEADLAAELDELLRAGEIEAPAVDPSAQEPGVSALDAELAQLREEDLIEPPAQRPAPVEAPAAAPAPGEPAAQPAPARPQRPRRPKLRLELVPGLLNECVDFLQRTAPVVAQRIEPAAHQVAGAMSRPLHDKPPIARQIVGWLALYTGFLAMCVWVYLLLFRGAPEGEPPPDAPAIVGAAEAK